jgi:large subunit ribosomal protein L15
MRGGKGRAGGRKHFWIRTVKYEPDRYEKKGFKPPSSLEPEDEGINIGELEDLALKTFGVKEYEDGAEIDLGSMEYDKLLGRGSIKKAFRVKVPAHSSKALEKIESAGGKIIQ